MTCCSFQPFTLPYSHTWVCTCCCQRMPSTQQQGQEVLARETSCCKKKHQDSYCWFDNKDIFRLFQFTTVITGAKKLDMLLPTLPGSSPHPKYPKAVKFETRYVQKLHDLVEFYSRPSPIVETLECNAKNHVHVHCINYSISSWAKGMAQSLRKHTVLLIRICTRK